MENNTQPPNYNYPEEEEFTFTKIFKDRMSDLRYLWKFKFKIFLIGIAGASIGLLIAWCWPVSYTSKLTFVVEDSKGGSGSLLSGLAGQFGFDLGGVAGSGSVLAGDNVFQLLKSYSIIKTALLSPYQGKSNYSLADRYAEVNKLKEQWEKYKVNGKAINFPVANTGYTRLQDSLLQIIILRIKDNELSVSKPDKKLSFFELNATMSNEELAKLFSIKLIDVASDFYIRTKTQRQRVNLDRLQTRADSLVLLLNKKTYSASEANTVLLDGNPAYPTANVNIELKDRDKNVLQTIYAEVVKNLETGRMMLAQETPTFQLVDQPDGPLKKNKMSKLKSIFLGGLFGVFISGLFFLWRKTGLQGL
jgi:hypothetical protein